MSLTETRIQNRLYFDLWQGCMLIVPNYTPGRWWECDLWSVTRAGYGIEHEIKLTRADFKKDAQKARHGFKGRYVGDKFDGYDEWTESKYGKLAQGHTDGPSRFYYVTPEGMLKAEEIPEWAGWKEVEERGSNLLIHTRKDAPTLHRQKVDDRIIRHALGVFYYRYWTLRGTSPTPDVIAAIEPREDMDAGPAILGPADARVLKAEEFNLFTEAL